MRINIFFVYSTSFALKVEVDCRKSELYQYLFDLAASIAALPRSVWKDEPTD